MNLMIEPTLTSDRATKRKLANLYNGDQMPFETNILEHWERSKIKDPELAKLINIALAEPSFTMLTRRHPIVRGIISYAVLWPCGSLAEQTLIEKRTFKDYDWIKCLRFSLYGGLFMGPTIYVWIRLLNVMWPRADIRSSLSKAITEQVAYDPMAICAFLFCMSLLEGKSYDEAKQEVSGKFLDAYKVGVIYWPCVQTVNFAFVPIHNQAVFTSFFSMCWTTFLAYVKYLELPNVDVDHHFIDIHLLEFH